MRETTTNPPTTLPEPRAADGLTIAEARDLLDWLEAHDAGPMRVEVEESGRVTVRWGLVLAGGANG